MWRLATLLGIQVWMNSTLTSDLNILYSQVEREKLQTEEFAHKSVYNRDNVDRTLSRLEEDNISLQRQLQEMQAALAEAEQTHAQRWGLQLIVFFLRFVSELLDIFFSPRFVSKLLV